MKSFLAPCTAIFLLSASIAGASPIPSGNNAYAIRDIISEPYMFPPEVSGDMDLWDGFGDDIHHSGVTDEGLASRSTDSLVPKRAVVVGLPTNGANGAASASINEVGANGARGAAALTSVFSTSGANGANHEAAVTLASLTGGANGANHEAAVTLAPLTGGANGADREAALALVSMTGGANRPPPSNDHGQFYI